MITVYQGKYFTVRVIIPDRTPEEQAIRDREIEDSIRAMYLRDMEKERMKGENKGNVKIY